MKNKKIWIGLLIAFLIIGAACLHDMSIGNNDNENTVSADNGINTPLLDENQSPSDDKAVPDDLNDDSDKQNINNEEQESSNKDLTRSNSQEPQNDTEDTEKVTDDQEDLPDKAEFDQERTKSQEVQVVQQAEKQEQTGDKDSQDENNTESTKKILDKYNTEAVPEGKPQPVEWQDVKVDKDKKLKCTLSVVCKTILDNMDDLKEEKKELIPEDGVIYKAQEVTFYEGESVFNILLREMKKNKIHMEFEMTPIFNSNYIEGIANLYEMDCGELSGWMYKVNGWFPNYGSSRYKLSDGDVVEWIYTCDLGRDIGDTYMTEE